jgi:hypothetical protein
MDQHFVELNKNFRSSLNNIDMKFTSVLVIFGSGLLNGKKNKFFFLDSFNLDDGQE